MKSDDDMDDKKGEGQYVRCAFCLNEFDRRMGWNDITNEKSFLMNLIRFSVHFKP